MKTFYRLKEDGSILDYTEIDVIYDEEGNVPAFIREQYIETDRRIIKLTTGAFAFEDEVNLEAEAKRKAEKEFNEAKKAKLTEVDAWTANKITGGFVSTCYNGENVLYDTDQDTQITMTIAKSLCESERFAEELPNGMECRGYEQVGTDADGTMVFSKDKTIYYFSPEQVKGWIEDFGLHLRECKKQGWIKQAQVNACTTKEELESIVLE